MSPPSRLSPARKTLFALIATVVGLLVLLGGLELGLLLAGAGHSSHFVRQTRAADGTRWWRENRWCTAPYFTPALARHPQPLRLAVDKPADHYRIIVLGSSAAMGDPEASFSLGRTLELLLQDAVPGVRFEVVNAGITAINSHLVRGIAADCVELSPDLFIVYEGHNEVIGPFGPASVLLPLRRSHSIVRILSWLQGTRTAQALGAAMRALHAKDVPQEWGGMQMFLEQEIASDDPRLRWVEEHFRANLRAVAGHAARAGASTLLCTVLTNQRDFAPFRSRHRPDLSADEQAEWEQRMTEARMAERQRDPAAAERAYQRAQVIDPGFAETAFRLGRVQLQLGKAGAARGSLQRALDLDTLRFRTDSRLNDAIRAEARSLPGATLVDLARELEPSSPHGVIGDDFLYEHVHLNLRGTYEVAARLAVHVAHDLQRRGRIAALPTQWLGLDVVRRRLAYTTYEQALIAGELLNRFKAPPFAGQIDAAARIGTWQARVDAANGLLSRPEVTDGLAALYAEARQHRPDDWVLARNAGAMFVARGRPAEAIPLLRAALAIIPDDPDTLVALGLACRATGQTAEAEAVFAQVRALEPDHPLLDRGGKAAPRG